MQGHIVEESLASAIDKVGGTTDLRVTHQVAVSVFTGTIGILPTLEITIGDDNAVSFGIECQSLSLIGTSVTDGQVVERHILSCHVDGRGVINVALSSCLIP